VGNATLFTKLDLAQGFHQIATHSDEESRKLAVVTPDCLFEYKRMPFGVANGPAVFAKLLQILLEGQSNCIGFIDDLPMFLH